MTQSNNIDDDNMALPPRDKNGKHNSTSNEGIAEKQEDISGLKTIPSKEYDEKEQDKSSKCNTTKNFRARYTPIEKFTLGLLIFTIIYAITSIVQVYLDNSPYIGVDPSSTSMSRSILGQKVQFIIGIKNVGKMTARNTSFTEVIVMVDPGEKLHWEKLHKPKAGFDGADILPGAIYPTPIESNFILTQQMIDDIKSGKQILTVLMRFDYKDVFGISHTTTVCEHVLINEGRLGLCKNRNCADQ